jgi:hypothetical protein
MTTEIKRKTWSQFCKKFNATNQYRTASVSVKQKARGAVDMDHDTPFMGISIAKKGRLIDGIAVYTGKYDPDKLTEPTYMITQPEKIVIEQNNGSDSRLVIRSKDGTEARLELVGQRDDGQYRSFVEKVAYTIYERRGHSTGHDFDDWLEAEKRIKEAELQLTR